MAVNTGLGRDQSENLATAISAPPSLYDVGYVDEALPAGVDNAQHDEELDEGGARAWLSILGSFLVYFASFGVANSFGYFQTFYQLDYLKDYTPSVISFIGTIQITLLYLTGSIAGALFDSYGLKVRAPHPHICTIIQYPAV